MASRVALERFKAVSAASNDHGSAPQAPASAQFAQWSPQRIAAYKDSLATKQDLPLAILRIPKISLEVPVFNDTDDLTLNRGVGRILGTARIGQRGNVGIAEHRDGYFRGPKDVPPNDSIELVRAGHTDHYVITGIQIVNPDNVHVLDATAEPTLTLLGTA